MQENTYNCNSMYRCFSRTSNETFQVSVYNSTVSMSIFRKNSENRQPIIKVPMSPEACIQLVNVLKSLQDAAPETRVPYIHQVFNKETRNYESYTTFVFYKDEKRCYGIEATSRQYSTPIVFPLKAPSTFTTGNEPMSEEKRSLLALRHLIQIFEFDIPLTRNLTRFNMKPVTRGPLSKNRQPGGASRDPYSSSDNLGGSEESSVFG